MCAPPWAVVESPRRMRLRGLQPVEQKPKIDLSHISRPGDVLRAIQQQKEQRETQGTPRGVMAAPPPRPTVTRSQLELRSRPFLRPPPVLRCVPSGNRPVSAGTPVSAAPAAPVAAGAAADRSLLRGRLFPCRARRHRLCPRLRRRLRPLRPRAAGSGDCEAAIVGIDRCVHGCRRAGEERSARGEAGNPGSRSVPPAATQFQPAPAAGWLKRRPAPAVPVEPPMVAVRRLRQ